MGWAPCSSPAGRGPDAARCLLEESVLSLKGRKDQPPRMVARNNCRQGHFQKVEKTRIRHHRRWNLLRSAVAEDGTRVWSRNGLVEHIHRSGANVSALQLSLFTVLFTGKYFAEKI